MPCWSTTINKTFGNRDLVWGRPSDIVRKIIQMSETLMTRQDILSEDIFLGIHTVLIVDKVLIL